MKTTGYSRGPERAKGSSPPAVVRADSNGVKKKKRKMRTAQIDWKALDDDPDAFVELRKHLKRHSPKAKRIRGGAF